ncbi:sacsin N-terminal ATP-binding-like domain-containing protein [Microcella pacifica]|uniref:DEAD/DEAH box helicase family protein n=1 Tax=Microcella pacifica TaxID=2591847 RepID=A0A9E5JQP0_9MICO|nr:helicase-related protein [Microcella pacifica]NHF63840.1 DEAD/DEAH box helicase family protein [Microcella pacifica]
MLEAQVVERQRITIENYRNDPDLLAEHVGMEDNFQAGGYGERQVEELLQNAIDQLGSPGRVELRLADGSLYCANEGTPFASEGIRAITGAFLSSKDDEKIGRFGLGFKSVLGVTNQPQILSQTISFGFNEPEAKSLLAELPYETQRVPTLRVPSVLHAQSIAADDPNVAELMEWASTVVKLPLARGGERLRRRLEEFDVRYLLFPENLAQVDIVLADAEGELGRRVLRRRPGTDPALVQLQAPDGETSEWRVLRRDHHVSDDVASDLPGLFRRDQVTVSYALEVGKSGVGEFWAWFPLQDQTTASGIFNAPWQVNDDRTSMLPGSALNRELLGVAAELLIDAALLESTPEDPAQHFDVLPARGRETRSAADRFLSERIPLMARRHELIPTGQGEMRAPSRVRAPFLSSQPNPFDLPAEVMQRWSDATKDADAPHWSCYRTPTRRARLAQLLLGDDERAVCVTVTPSAWLSEAAEARSIDAIDAALSVFLRLKQEKDEIWKQFQSALIIPLEGGGFARAADAATVLLPVALAEAPAGVSMVEGAFAEDPGLRRKLEELGAKDVSADQVALATAMTGHANWTDADWSQFWTMLAKATPSGGKDALESLETRRVPIKVQTDAGTWREAVDVFLDPAMAPGIPARQPSFQAVSGRRDLLELAGCIVDPHPDYPVHRERAFEIYSKKMQQDVNAKVQEEYGRGKRATLKFGDPHGAGPLDVLIELAENPDPHARRARADWSTRILLANRTSTIDAGLRIYGQDRDAKVTMTAPDIWAVEAFGLVNTSLGAEPLKTALATSLSQFGQYLAVVTPQLAGAYSLPRSLSDAPDDALRLLFTRDDYTADEPERLGEVLAEASGRPTFTGVDEIPAFDPKSQRIRLTPVLEVVLATTEEMDDLGSHSLRYIPSGPCDDALVSAWSVQRASDVIARAIDWTPVEDSVPILDVYPSLRDAVANPIEDLFVRRCSRITRRTTSPAGVREQRLPSHLDGKTVLVDAELDPVSELTRLSAVLRLGLTEADAARVIASDEALRQSKLVQDVLAESSEAKKLLLLVGREELVENLPHGLLGVIERRQGRQSDLAVAELFITTRGNDSLRWLKEPLSEAGLAVPRAWAGSAEADQFVTSLGFPRTYAGTREKKATPTELVPGRVDLKPLHRFQEDLRNLIRELVLIRDKDGDHRRGLLYLPTGAGKTRVTTESIVAMLRDEELASPVLWIAQSEELCEQAILSWAEVWRAIGDERPLEITRYWGNYEADESLQELQVVVATDAKLASMIDRGSRAHGWLQNSKLVVIDEAHTAGSPTYTKILSWLGITRDARGSSTARPLLGLTATPYRGTNVDVNKQFVARFGERRLNALDLEDPIGQLRDMQVLSRVEHQLLDGVIVDDAPTEGITGGRAWDDVSRATLARLGENLDRTQQLVDHIMRQHPEWPILVFTPSVVSAHVTAALIRSLGRHADAVDGEMRGQERRRKIDAFKAGDTKVLVNCDLLTQGFDAPKVRALYIARPTFSPNRYVQMVGRGLRGPLNGGTEECLVVNMVDTFTQFDRKLAFTEFDYLWTKKGVKNK